MKMPISIKIYHEDGDIRDYCFSDDIKGIKFFNLHLKTYYKNGDIKKVYFEELV